MSEVLPRIGLGTVAGLLATVPMTAVMLAAQRRGWLGEAPPKKITKALLDPPTGTKRLATAFTHFGFGAAAGAIYGWVRARPPGPARGALEGAGFGTAVWAASYAGWVPALGILPPPQDDRPDRQATMLVAHWVFGATLGALVSLGRTLRQRTTGRRAGAGAPAESTTASATSIAATSGAPKMASSVSRPLR
jgi:hypothetical protein